MLCDVVFTTYLGAVTFPEWLAHQNNETAAPSAMEAISPQESERRLPQKMIATTTDTTKTAT